MYAQSRTTGVLRGPIKNFDHCSATTATCSLSVSDRYRSLGGMYKWRQYSPGEGVNQFWLLFLIPPCTPAVHLLPSFGQEFANPTPNLIDEVICVWPLFLLSLVRPANLSRNGMRQQGRKKMQHCPSNRVFSSGGLGICHDHEGFCAGPQCSVR